MAVTLTVFVLSIGLVMFRPRPFSEASASILGAAVLIILGVISPIQTWEVFRDNANVILFFLGLMITSVIAEQAGFFEWCAFKAVKLAHGRGSLLLSIVFGLGTLTTAFFSNDATVLILTPLVFALVTRLRLNVLPYVFACAFIANTASMLLPISNPVNLVAVGRFDLTMGEYLKYLLVPSILVIAANILLFRVIFHKDISAVSSENSISGSVKIDCFFLCVCAGLALTATGYILASIFGLPLAYPAIGGAIVLLVCGLVFQRIDIHRVTGGISWSIFVFIFAMALLVKGLENSGVIQTLAEGLASLASLGSFFSLLAVTLGTAFGSNLINNWPMMMVSVSSLDSLAASTAGFDRALVYGAIMGADLGPNIAVLGSLSSMLWLILLRRRGLIISPLQFLKLGLIVTPLMLIIGVIGLYACSRFWG